MSNEFKINNNIEEYTENNLLLKSNETIASLKKDNYLITVEVNGEVEIEDKKGNNIPIYSQELKEAISNNKLDEKYNIINNNWLEVMLYKQDKQRRIYIYV